MKFERKQYLDELISCDGNGMIKIVTGIRRCGKSYLLFRIFRDYLIEKGVHEDHIIGIAFDDRKNRHLLNPDALLNYIDEHIVKDGQKTYIILDEIQLVDEFVSVLLSLMHVEDTEVYVSGSNSKFLSSDVVTEFRGRGWEIRMRPLSFGEYFEVAGGDYQEALNDYFRYGGLPGVVQLKSAEQKQQYLKEIYETVYLRDVIERNRLHNSDGLRQLVRVLASGIGASTNTRRIVNTFKSMMGGSITPLTVSRYIEMLQNAFIVSEALRYDVKGRRYIGTETKYYFEDPGIRNAVIDFRQIEPTHLMENVIYNELRRTGFLVDVGLVEVFERDKDGKVQRKNLEVDFIVNRSDQRIYIQSAYMLPDREKVKQEQASLLHIPDGFRKVIIEGMRYGSNYNEDGIKIVSLKDFLTKEGSVL